MGLHLPNDSESQCNLKKYDLRGKFKYSGRCFKNDTERLEKLFDLYAKMTNGQMLNAKIRPSSWSSLIC